MTTLSMQITNSKLEPILKHLKDWPPWDRLATRDPSLRKRNCMHDLTNKGISLIYMAEQCCLAQCFPHSQEKHKGTHRSLEIGQAQVNT